MRRADPLGHCRRGAINLDVTKPDETPAARALGDVTLLVNNAGPRGFLASTAVAQARVEPISFGRC